MDGYFTKGKELNHNENLLEMVKVLNSNQYLEEVNTDIREAQMYGIQSIPFFIFEDRLAVSGAQSVEVFIFVFLFPVLLELSTYPIDNLHLTI